MVSLRCILWVKAEMQKLDIPYYDVRLGEVELCNHVSLETFNKLEANLNKAGLEIIEDKKKVLVEKIKLAIIDLIHHTEELPKENYSFFLSKKLDQSYVQLANIFSELEHITIEHFIIAHKIEKVKELLSYDELTLSEISEKLHYSSAAHLSGQFKKVTGITPSHYKGFHAGKRKPIDGLFLS